MYTLSIRRCDTRSIAILLLAMWAALDPQNGRAATLAAYAALPSIENVALSPEGTRLAYVRTDGDRRIIVIANVADHKMIRWVSTGTERLRNLQWADEDNLLITTAANTSTIEFPVYWYFLRVYNVPKNELHFLPGDPLGQEGHTLKTVVGTVQVRRIDGHTVVFMPGLFWDGLALYRCDLTTGLTSLVRLHAVEYGTAAPSVLSWLVDGQGRLVASDTYTWQTQRWSIRAFDGSDSRELSSGRAALDYPEILGFGPQGERLLVQSIEGGERAWRLLSLKDGKFSPMPRNEVFSSPLLDRSSRMVGGMNIGDQPQYLFFDPTWEFRWQAIVKALAGDEVQLVSHASDFSKVVVLAEGPTSGYRYILIDLVKNNAVPIAKVYDGIGQPLEVRRITYTAGDGLPIPAYLTLPPHRPARHLALIVLPHNEPNGHDAAGFDWWAQALAAQGYAVLQPNYRGSDLDAQFERAGFGQWGRKMQTDLSDGVRYLIDQGIADPARACIVGEDYGGYAALAAATLQPTLYRCAVSIDGISDLGGMLRWWRVNLGGYADWISHYFERWWGVSGDDDPALDAISPIEHVDAVSAPVLLIHGRDDIVVPYEQSQRMFDALRDHHKEVQLVTLSKGDAWLSRSESRLHALEATVAFLEAHDPPD